MTEELTQAITKQKRLPKFRRVPDKLEPITHAKHITQRDIEIIDLIERYRFLPTSLILKLIEGDKNNTSRHLQALFHNGYINRFVFPRLGFYHSEFNYYIDNRRALDLLVEHGADKEALDWTSAGRNAEKNYAALNVSNTVDDMQGRLMHLKHELMVSRFHAALELGCRQTKGKVKLTVWMQGTALHDYVEAPKLIAHKVSGGAQGEYLWRESDLTEKIPHRPDAYFVLSFPEQNREDQHFFYEADRETTNTTKMNRKLRGHFHYIVKKKKHEARYGFKRVRAVLIETTNASWADKLRESAKHPLVSGNAASPLFWFTTSQILMQPQETEANGRKTTAPLYLARPEIIFKKIWASPASDELLSLTH